MIFKEQLWACVVKNKATSTCSVIPIYGLEKITKDFDLCEN